MNRWRALAVAVLVLTALGAGLLLWPDDAADTSARDAASTADDSGAGASARRERSGPRLDRWGAEVTDAGLQNAWVVVVSAADGKPIPNAHVTLLRPRRKFDENDLASFRTFHHIENEIFEEVRRRRDQFLLTDAAGRVAFPDISTEPHDLSVECLWYLSHREPLVSGSTIALEPTPSLSGVVLSHDRRPVPGATVTSTGDSPVTTRTGPDGRFSLRPAEVDQFVAEKDGRIGISDRIFPELEVGNEPVEIILQDVESSSARVTDSAGQPLSGVEVEVSVYGLHFKQRTGGDGVFRIPTLEDHTRVARFSRSGYATTRREYGGFSRAEDVQLFRPTGIDGRLVDGTGRAVAGVAVTASGTEEMDAHPPPAVTDAEGRFAFSGLGTTILWLSAGEEPGPTAEEVFQLEEGKTRAVTLVLRPELVEVPVEVVTASGRKVYGYSIVATPQPPLGWTSRGSEAVELKLCRGRFQFEVESNDGRTCSEVREIDPQPGAAPLQLTVRGDGGQDYEDELPPVMVRVLAVDPHGAPLSDAGVECYDAYGRTGADGRFTCAVHGNDHAWPVQILIKHGDATGLARATGNEPEVRVVVGRAGVLRGRVDGALPNEPLSIRVRTKEEDRNFPLSGNSFELEKRPPIRTYLCVERERSFETLGENTLGCSVSEAGEEVVISVGERGTLRFTSFVQGNLLRNPILYVDRVGFKPFRDGDGQTLPLPPGQHVMVLNDPFSRARYETRFVIQPGKVTDLGVLNLQ